MNADDLLPAELWQNIVQLLDLKDRVMFSMCCKFVREVTEDRKLWKQLFQRRDGKFAVIAQEHLPADDAKIDWKKVMRFQEQYPNIQTAIAAAAENARIYIAPAVYVLSERVFFGKSVELYGEKSPVPIRLPPISSNNEDEADFFNGPIFTAPMNVFTTEKCKEITLKRICLSPHQTERETETLGLEILRGVTKVHVEGLLIRALWCIVIDMTESLRDVVVKSCTFKRTACALLLQQSSANWLRNFFLSGSKKPKETPDPVLPHRILISQNDIIGDNQSGGVGVALATNGWTKDDRVYISNNRIRQCTSGVRLGCWRKNRNLKSEPEPDLTAELTEAKALGFPEGKVIIARNRLKCAIVVAMSFYSTIALLDNEIEVTNEEAIFSMGTNCAGTLTGNKITVRGSVLFGAMASQVFLYSKNKEKIHRENEITEEEIASPDVLEAIRDGVCTFVKTGPDFQAQYWWNCATCDWPNGSGVCAVCKDICHKGHKLTTMQQGFLFQGSPANFCRFYCDCGSRFCDDTISCLALRSRKK